MLIPYHGKPDRHENEIYRSQPKSGTRHFHAYATCYVIKKGFRYTVALTPVTKGEEMKEVLQRLLKQCKEIGIKCGLLLVDFHCCAGGTRFLQCQRDFVFEARTSSVHDAGDDSRQEADEKFASRRYAKVCVVEKKRL